MRLTLSLVVLALLAGCTGPPVEAATATAAPDPAVLERWARWSSSGLTQDGYPELPRRDDCAEDPGTGYWFVGAPNTTTESWRCPVPVGRSLVLVASNMSLTGGVECTPGMRETVGAGGTASLDGEPVSLTWAWPVDKQPGIATCALWGVTGPLPAGEHTVELTSTTNPVRGAVTVSVTVS